MGHLTPRPTILPRPTPCTGQLQYYSVVYDPLGPGVAEVSNNNNNFRAIIWVYGRINRRKEYEIRGQK